MIETKHMVKVTTQVSEWCSDHASPTGALSRVWLLMALNFQPVHSVSHTLKGSHGKPWVGPTFSTQFSKVSVPLFYPLGTPSHLPAFQALMFSPFQVKKSRRDFKSTPVSGLRRSRVLGENIKGIHEASLRAQCLMLGGLGEASWPAPVCSEMPPFVGDHVPSCRWAEAVLQWMVQG